VIFDAHAHVYPAAGGFWKRASSAEALIDAMDAAGVGRAAVIAIEPDLPVGVVCAAAARYPDRFVPIGSVHPLHDGAAAAVDRQVKEFAVRGIKVHPRLQGIRFGDLPRLQEVAARCGELEVPLIVCSFAGGRDLFEGRTLELCHELAASVPETNIIMAHAGGHRPLDALMVLKANANIHVDLSFSPVYFAHSSVTQDLEYLVRRSDPSRLLFGSDFPEAAIDTTLQWLLGVFDRGGLPPAHRAAILHDNAARLFATH
jgi:predicted TIM-barrel fold metal-dependent hydrolase